MINELMMRFAQIRSSYARKKFGNLSDGDKALNEYDRFCLELIKEIEQLKEQINTYEDPEDMTLMFMWCNEKAKDKIKQLKEVIEEVRKSLEDYQEYIDEAKKMYSDLDDDNIVKASCMQILNNQMVRNYDLLRTLDKAKNK